MFHREVFYAVGRAAARLRSRSAGGCVRVMVAGLVSVVASCGPTDGGAGDSASGDGDPPESAPLTIGMELTYPPFEMVDASGNPSGIGVELAKAIAESLDRPLEIENIAFDGLIVALKSGRVDLVISSMTANDERRKSIDFSDPYVRTGLSLLVPADSAAQGIDDLKAPGNRIVVKLGTTGEAYANAHLPDADVVVLDEDIACVLEVAQNKADAFIYDQLSVYRHHQKHPDTTRAILAPFQQEVWAVGLRKGDDALREAVNAALADFRASGGFERLAETYLKEEKAMLESQGIPFIFD